jgi:hypothetical protein
LRDSYSLAVAYQLLIAAAAAAAAAVFVQGTTDSITMLNNGCLCCTVRDDLVIALNKLWERRDSIDHIIIETTGRGLFCLLALLMIFWEGGGLRWMGDVLEALRKM